MENKNEIDLIELFLKIYLYLKKYIWILVIAISIGIVFTVLKNMFQQSQYTSSMILKTKPENDYMYALTFKEFQNRFEKNPGELIIKIINSANNLRQNENIPVLANRMNLEEEQVLKISSVKAIYKYTKGEAISNFVTISVNSTSKDVYKDLAKGIVNYINNNDYIKEKNKADSIFLTQVIKEIELKINELDSLQSIFLKAENKSDIIIVNGNSFISENIMLRSLKENLTKELSMIKQTKIVEDFYIPSLNKKSIKSDLIINVAIFVFFGLLIIFILLVNKKAKQYSKNH